jgi:putative spermidine/putrescine transport system ATP-binding protein
LTTSDSGEAFVEFREVQKSYDGQTLVVKNLNLAMPKGEFLTLLGPSGSGKTTCLMMLAGFEGVTSGEIRLDGRDISRVAPHQRGIGMVFQNYALFPHMTVAENLAFPLQVRKRSRDEIASRVRRALEMVELPHLAERRPAQLSGGQQQRVAVARALVFEPTLVLMDEPLGALDKNLREQMQYEIKHLHENLGLTVVYVTHDQHEALTMSDRIAVFRDGVVQQFAPPAELYEQPQNAFVAAFIGENNRIYGKVRSLAGGLCVVELDDGSEVRAQAVKVAAAGQRTMVSLRPERVQINPAQGRGDNVFSARVEELIYLGDHIRTRVSVCGNDKFIVKIPNAQDHARLAVGDTITVAWAQDDCRALDA